VCVWAGVCVCVVCVCVCCVCVGVCVCVCVLCVVCVCVCVCLSCQLPAVEIICFIAFMSGSFNYLPSKQRKSMEYHGISK